MGKDLKGKELGKGITQRKNGKYSARFTSKNKKRTEKYFDKLSEARKWLAESKYEDEHGNIGSSTDMTVNAWYNYWINEIKKPTVRWSTLKNYKDRYEFNIKELLGNMKISDVKPMHCQNVLNSMSEKYKSSSIKQCRITMSSIFHYAEINDIIPSNPVNNMVKLPKTTNKKIRFLTIEEQNKFLEVAKDNSKYHQFLFILQTGLRCGEMMGLKWEDIDFENRKIYVKRTLTFSSKYQEFIVGEPKTENGYRTIPMTQTAYDILKIKYAEKSNRKVCNINYADYVFINKNGLPTKNPAYDSCLYKLAKKAGLEKFSMHSLRHTYATRCIESGMRPKTLQDILGHSNIGVTMNLYVHNTEEEKENEIKKFEQKFNYKVV